jgi:hypothetical protein
MPTTSFSTNEILLDSTSALCNYGHTCSVRSNYPIYTGLQNLMSVYLSIYGFTGLLLDLGRFFSFLIVYTIGRIPWTGDQPVARPLPTHRITEA